MEKGEKVDQLEQQLTQHTEELTMAQNQLVEMEVRKNHSTQFSELLLVPIRKRVRVKTRELRNLRSVELPPSFTTLQSLHHSPTSTH